MTYLKEILTQKIEIEYNYARSHWRRGVIDTALDLIDDIDGEDLLDLVLCSSIKDTKKILLGGAEDEKQYSYYGCMLCYDQDIAERFCTPSELKKKKGGNLNPSKGKTWLDVQARAICQAMRIVQEASWKAKFEIENRIGKMKKGDEMTESYIRA